MGQAVDQVQVDGTEAQPTRFIQHGLGHFPGLDAIHRLLHFGIHILDTQADAVEAQVPECLQCVLVHFARVNLHAVIPVFTGLQVEQFGVTCHQVFHHVFGQERGRTAAPVQLCHRPIRTEQTRLDCSFLQQPLHVWHGLVALFGDHFVAGAVVAEVCAEWQVGIQRQWPAAGLAAGGCLYHVFHRVVLVELHCRRIGGVAWAAEVVTADQRFVPDEFREGGFCGFQFGGGSHNRNSGIENGGSRDLATF